MQHALVDVGLELVHLGVLREPDAARLERRRTLAAEVSGPRVLLLAFVLFRDFDRDDVLVDHEVDAGVFYAGDLMMGPWIFFFLKQGKRGGEKEFGKRVSEVREREGGEKKSKRRSTKK